MVLGGPFLVFSIGQQAVETFHFGASPVGSGESVIELELENRGKVETEW